MQFCLGCISQLDITHAAFHGSWRTPCVMQAKAESEGARDLNNACLNSHLSQRHWFQNCGIKPHPWHKTKPEQVSHKAGGQGVRLNVPWHRYPESDWHDRQGLAKSHKPSAKLDHASAICHDTLCKYSPAVNLTSQYLVWWQAIMLNSLTPEWRQGDHDFYHTIPLRKISSVMSDVEITSAWESSGQQQHECTTVAKLTALWLFGCCLTWEQMDWIRVSAAVRQILVDLFGCMP